MNLSPFKNIIEDILVIFLVTVTKYLTLETKKKGLFLLMLQKFQLLHALKHGGKTWAEESCSLVWRPKNTKQREELRGRYTLPGHVPGQPDPIS